jgi:uncharacterized phage infection (PIP) family protein YhgE
MTEKDLLVSRMQEENFTPNDFTRRLREMEGEGDLFTLKERDEEYERGLAQIREAINDQTKKLQETATPITKFQHEIQQNALNKAQSKLKRQSTKKLVINQAFDARAGAAEEKEAEQVVVEEDKHEETQEEKEARVKTIREKRVKKVEGDTFIKQQNKEYKELVAQLENISPKVDVKTENPQLYARLKQFLEINHKSTGALKKAGGMVNHLRKYFNSIENRVEEERKNEEYSTKERKERKLERRPPKEPKSPFTIDKMNAAATAATTPPAAPVLTRSRSASFGGTKQATEATVMNTAPRPPSVPRIVPRGTGASRMNNK